MSALHWKYIGQPGRASSFLLKRFSRIYPPLWAALILASILIFLVKGSLPSIFFLFNAAFITPLGFGSSEPLLAVEWTLRHEILFYGFFSLIILRPKIGFAVFVAWVACGAILPSAPENWYGVLISPYNVGFPFGMLAAAAFKFEAFSGKRAPLAVALGTLLCALTALVHAQRDLSMFSQVVGYSASSMLILIGCVELERSGRLSVGWGLVFLGDASYSIFLVHFLAVSAAAKFAVKFVELGMPNIVALAGVVLASLLFGVIYYLVVEKFILAHIIGLFRKESIASKPA